MSSLLPSFASVVQGLLTALRRRSADRVDYLTVQFNSAGGSFAVGLAAAGSHGKPPGYGKHLPIEKLNVQYFPRRLRLGSDPDRGIIDHWFAFGPRSYDPPAAVPEYDHFLRIAADAATYLDTQAEQWLKGASLSDPT